jgi:hypothetical protein
MYSFKAFRRDLEELRTQTLRTVRPGWFSRLTMAFMKLPADLHQVRDQAILDVNRSHELTMRVLAGIGPFLSLEERDGVTVVVRERISEIANLAKVPPKEVQDVIELYRQFSNSEWRENLFATIAKGRRARFQGIVTAMSLVVGLVVSVAFLCWAVRTLLSPSLQ